METVDQQECPLQVELGVSYEDAKRGQPLTLVGFGSVHSSLKREKTDCKRRFRSQTWTMNYLDHCKMEFSAILERL